MKVKETYPNLENCNPSSCISAKIRKCDRIVANVFRKHLHPFGITDSQLSILFVVTKKAGMNQAKLAQFLYLEKSTVHRNLNRLLEKGYVQNKKKEDLSITVKGKQFLEEVVPHWENAMTEMKTILQTEGEEALALFSSNLMDSIC